MAQFITRVELHSATPEDYERLDAEMGKRLFSRHITHNGARYRLPAAEYVSYSTALDASGVAALANQAAILTERQAWVLTTEGLCALGFLPRV